MSNICRPCGVWVPYNSNCPLCGKFVREIPRAARYPVPQAGRKVSPKKILRFVFLVLGFLTLFLDWFLTKFQGWSVIACIGLFWSWTVIIKPIFDRHPLGMYVLFGVPLSISFLFLLDIGTGYAGWSVSYVAPAAAAAGIVLLMFAALIRRVHWNEIGMYLILLTILDGVILVLGFCRLHPYNGVAFIVLAFSLICLFAMQYFRRRDLKEELNRRLHM